GAGRGHQQPAALWEVLQAGVCEVEGYPRIRVAEVADVGVDPSAIEAVVHIAAELLDNATAFSVEAEVAVTARAHDGGVLVEINDTGVGIGPQRLADRNARLASPPQYAEVTARTGLSVRARLAAQHGIGVTLRPGTGRGTVARITLPAALLTPAPAPATLPL